MDYKLLQNVLLFEYKFNKYFFTYFTNIKAFISVMANRGNITTIFFLFLFSHVFYKIFKNWTHAGYFAIFVCSD